MPRKVRGKNTGAKETVTDDGGNRKGAFFSPFKKSKTKSLLRLFRFRFNLHLSGWVCVCFYCSFLINLVDVKISEKWKYFFFLCSFNILYFTWWQTHFLLHHRRQRLKKKAKIEKCARLLNKWFYKKRKKKEFNKPFYSCYCLVIWVCGALIPSTSRCSYHILCACVWDGIHTPC